MSESPYRVICYDLAMGREEPFTTQCDTLEIAYEELELHHADHQSAYIEEWDGIEWLPHRRGDAS